MNGHERVLWSQEIDQWSCSQGRLPWSHLVTWGPATIAQWLRSFSNFYLFSLSFRMNWSLNKQSCSSCLRNKDHLVLPFQRGSLYAYEKQYFISFPFIYLLIYLLAYIRGHQREEWIPCPGNSLGKSSSIECWSRTGVGTIFLITVQCLLPILVSWPEDNHSLTVLPPSFPANDGTQRWPPYKWWESI
jgi:hypothetical protein